MVSAKDCSVAICGESTMFPLEGIAHITPHKLDGLLLSGIMINNVNGLLFISRYPE